MHNVIGKSIHDLSLMQRLQWNCGKGCYLQSNIRIHHLKREIALASQGNQTIMKYFTKLKALWDKLSVYLDDLNCKCRKDFKLNKFFEGERVYRLLMGLDLKHFKIARSFHLSKQSICCSSQGRKARFFSKRDREHGHGGSIDSEGGGSKQTLSKIEA